eukprot:1159720-Pelagomonas_calceolata.AAC.11
MDTGCGIMSASHFMHGQRSLSVAHCEHTICAWTLAVASFDRTTQKHVCVDADESFVRGGASRVVRGAGAHGRRDHWSLQGTTESECLNRMLKYFVVAYSFPSACDSEEFCSQGMRGSKLSRELLNNPSSRELMAAKLGAMSKKEHVSTCVESSMTACIEIEYKEARMLRTMHFCSEDRLDI